MIFGPSAPAGGPFLLPAPRPIRSGGWAFFVACATARRPRDTSSLAALRVMHRTHPLSARPWANAKHLLGGSLTARDQFSSSVARSGDFSGPRNFIAFSGSVRLVSDYPSGIVMTTLRSLPRNFISSRGQGDFRRKSYIRASPNFCVGLYTGIVLLFNVMLPIFIR